MELGEIGVLSLKGQPANGILGYQQTPRYHGRLDAVDAIRQGEEIIVGH